MKTFAYCLSITLLLFGVFLQTRTNTSVPSRLPKAERVAAAFDLEFERTRDPRTGEIPRERLIEAKSYRDQLVATRSGGISGVQWEERGPDNVGGRTRALLFDPNDPTGKRVFAGSVAGGLWVNADPQLSGSPWQAIDDFWANLAITCLAADPSDPQKLYAGTGEGFLNRDAVRGDGIWRSTDGGTTWNQLPSTASTSDFYFTNDLLVLGNGILVAATQRGIFQSTDDGTTWTRRTTIGTTDLELAADGDLYAGANYGRIYHSTDDGTTWNLILSTGQRRTEIACAPSDANVLYATAKKIGNSAADCAWIKRSDDGGATWTDLTIPSYCYTPSLPFTRGQAWYNLILHVHPGDANQLLLGGIDLHRSEDGGTTWTQASYGRSDTPCGGGNFLHADQHQIIGIPGNSDGVLIGNDGGVYVATDAYGSSVPNFTATNTGYAVTQFYACAMDPVAGSNTMLAGSQDNGTQRFSGSGINSTTEVTGGDGGTCYLSANGQIQITSYIYNSYRISQYGGPFQEFFLDYSGQFINPAVFDPAAGKLYASGLNNSYLRWNDPLTATPTSIDYEHVSLSGISGRVTSVVLSPSVAHRLYLGFDDGTIAYVDQVQTGNSKTPVVLRTGSGYVSDIAIDPDDEQHLLVTYSNYGVSSIFESINGGSSWIDVEGNLPDMPVRTVIFAPGNSQRALIGTELGVWSTNQLNGAGTSWGPTNGGLANVRVNDLGIRSADNVIAAATHGRGLFTTNSFTAGGAALPVRLSSFEAYAKDEHNLLNWATEEEIGFDRFEIERSVDGQTFEIMETIFGGAYSYSFKDFLIDKNQTFYFYRLKMVDSDGKSTYSDLSVVERKTETDLVLYPNPVVGELIVGGLDMVDRYDLYDASGKLVHYGVPESGVVVIDFSGFRKGVYLLVLRSGSRVILQERIVRG